MNKGFTLFEMAIVIMVVGLILATAINVEIKKCTEARDMYHETYNLTMNERGEWQNE